MSLTQFYFIGVCLIALGIVELTSLGVGLIVADSGVLVYFVGKAIGDI